MNFRDLLFAETNFTRTTNMAVTHRTSTSAVLDLYSQGGATRKWDKTKVENLVDKAIAENASLAVLTVFYLADVRGGQGERRFFEVAINYLARIKPRIVKAVLPLLAEYGRWDVMYSLVGTQLETNAFDVIKEQLALDIESKTPSLLGKWLKSENASSEQTKVYGKLTRIALGMTAKGYRKMLTDLRNKIGIVETFITQGNYDKIDYSKISSQAAMKYITAYFKNDESRYKQYLDSLKKGDKNVKMNTKTLYPYDLINIFDSANANKIEVADIAWDNLPNYFEGTDSEKKSILPMIDVSGSMYGKPLQMATGLGMYFAERCRGPFKDSFLTFSFKPTMQKLSGTTASKRYHNLCRADWTMNTNIEAAIMLILDTAVKSRLPQSDLPNSLLIISDMQFDECTNSRSYMGHSPHYGGRLPHLTKTLFQEMKQRFLDEGYQMPTVVFWNVDAHENQSPVEANEFGTVLVSGASPSAIGYVLGRDLPTPYAVMIDTLKSERYIPITKVLEKVL